MVNLRLILKEKDYNKTVKDYLTFYIEEATESYLTRSDIVINVSSLDFTEGYQEIKRIFNDTVFNTLCNQFLISSVWIHPLIAMLFTKSIIELKEIE